MAKGKRRVEGEPAECGLCHEWKPLTVRHFGKRSNGRYDSWCRACKRAHSQQYRANAPKVTPSRASNSHVPCVVIVAENDAGVRRALKYHEWDNVPDGWTVIGTGSELLGF